MKMGLVGWKDQYMVYCLTSDCNTSETDTCFMRTQGGIIEIQHPIVILQYIRYTGGGLGGGNSRYVANSLQCNGYGNESVVVEVVI